MYRVTCKHPSWCGILLSMGIDGPFPRLPGHERGVWTEVLRTKSITLTSRSQCDVSRRNFLWLEEHPIAFDLPRELAEDSIKGIFSYFPV